MSATLTSRPISSTASASITCIGSVPLISDRPSLAASVSGSRPSSASSSALGRPAQVAVAPRGAAGPRRPAAGPGGRAGPGRRTRRPSPCPGSPAAGRGRAARAAGAGRSTPDAGVARRSGCGPAAAAGRARRRRAAARPTPALCERTRASCIRSRSARPDVGVGQRAEAGGDAVHHLVLLDGVGRRRARLGSIRAGHAGAELGRAWPRATSTRSSRSRASPVTVTVRMAGNLVGSAWSRTGRLPRSVRFGRGLGRSAMVSLARRGGRQAAPTSRGRGSVGRASPCQGEGRGFESRRPLGCLEASSGLTRWSGREARQRPAKPSTRVQIPSPPRVTPCYGRLAQSG